MGLDMYLKYRKNFSGYEFSGDESKAEDYKKIITEAGVSDVADAEHPFASVEVTAIYWRKANMIHSWFVDTLADGRDECQEIYVPREKLKELRDLCFDALSVPAGMTLTQHAETVLPTSSGFFFGSTDYDEWYVQDLKHTMDSIDNLLAALPEDGEGWDWSLYYQASW